MKVAHILSSFEHVAGTERFVIETTREMSVRRIHARIYTGLLNPKALGGLRGEVEIRKVDLIIIPMFQLYFNLSISKRLIDVAASWADVIILHTGLGMAEYAWRKRGVTCVPFFHIDKFDSQHFGRLRSITPVYTYPLRLQESRCVRNIPLAFANSRSLSNRVANYAKGGRLVKIPLGVDTNRFQPTWVDQEYALMVGRFHPLNNFELGLKAAFDLPCKIVIAGILEKKFLWYYQHLLQLVEASRALSDRVEFRVSNDDEELIGLIQNCSVFLSPRMYDYLGLATLEAMSCGKPVLTRSCDEESEYCPVITCGDQFSKWREALESLMGDDQLRENIGRESREFVEKHHTWKKTVDLMLESIKGPSVRH